MNFSTRVDFDEQWVMVPTSELGKDYLIGKIIETWANNVKVLFVDKDSKEHIGVYTIRKHAFVYPTLGDWFDYAALHN